MKLRVLKAAANEVIKAAHWYQNQRAGLGENFVDEYEVGLKVIKDDPHHVTRLETNQSRRDLRRLPLRRFPYLIIFEILSEEVVVLAVAHSSRRPNYWIKRKR